MKIFNILAVSGLGLALSVPAVAQVDADATKRMTEAVNKEAVERVDGLLQPGDILRLLVVARQRGLALNCEGFAVDEARFGLVMNDIVSDVAALTEPSQNNLPLDIVLGSYTMALGGQIAVAAYDPEAYCAEGEEVRAMMAGDNESRMSILATAD